MEIDFGDGTRELGDNHVVGSRESVVGSASGLKRVLPVLVVVASRLEVADRIAVQNEL